MFFCGLFLKIERTYKLLMLSYNGCIVKTDQTKRFLDWSRCKILYVTLTNNVILLAFSWVFRYDTWYCIQNCCTIRSGWISICRPWNTLCRLGKQLWVLTSSLDCIKLFKNILSCIWFFFLILFSSPVIKQILSSLYVKNLYRCISLCILLSYIIALSSFPLAFTPIFSLQ